MNCGRSDFWKDYYFGELPARERAAAEQHLTGCAGCREELRSIEAAWGVLRMAAEEEEPPRRIAFVSDPVLEPNWWQRFWQSGPRLGFASAAMLSAALLVHAFARPAPVVERPAAAAVVPVVAQAPGLDDAKLKAEVERRVALAVEQAVSQTEARLTVAFEKKQRELDLQRKADLVAISDYLENWQKRNNVMYRAANGRDGAE